MDDAQKGFDELGDSASGVSTDTAKAEKAIDKLADAVAEATDDTHGMSNEAQANAQQVKMLGAQYLEAKAKVDKLSKEYVETARATGETSDETQELSRKLQEAQAECKSYADQLEELGDAFGDASDGSKSLGDNLANAVFKGNLMTSAAGALWDGVKKVASAVWNMDEATEEYRVAQGKLNTAFEAAGYSTGAAAETYRDFYTILGDIDKATEASQLLAQLSTGQEDLSTWTDIAAGVWGTFGDSLPIESLIEAANETAKTGKVTGVLADALNWVGISEDEFNQKLAQCATTEERTALITDTLAGKYREATEIFKENNEVLIRARESQARLQDAQAKLGEETSRLKTALSSALSPALEKVYDWLEKATAACTDFAEKWEAAVHASDVPLDVSSAEEAKARLEEVNAELDRLREQGYNEINSSTFKTLESQAANLEEYIVADTAAMDEYTEATEKAAEVNDKMSLSAAGVTLEIENSNLSMEEASERFYSYAEAATNAFSQISTESELTYEQMVANLNHNADATREFGDNMAQIASAIPKEMADMFAAGGADMYAGVVKMLAEANKGADEGLTQLNEAYARGGLAAAEAFTGTMNGNLNVETENPATISAKAMDSDVRAEQAARDVVVRTATALQNAVNTAGFDGAGRNAMSKFVQGMESMRGTVMGVANSIAQQAVNAINSALASAAANASRVAAGYGSYRAGGLDYVPYNGYPSILHRGEAVLTAAEADDWRRGRSGGSNSSGITIIQNIEAVPQTPAEFAATTAAYFEQARWAV